MHTCRNMQARMHTHTSFFGAYTVMRDTKPTCDLRWIVRILSDTGPNTEPADPKLLWLSHSEGQLLPSAMTVLLTVCHARGQ